MTKVRVKPRVHPLQPDLPSRKQVTARWLLARDFSWPARSGPFADEEARVYEEISGAIRTRSVDAQSMSDFLDGVVARASQSVAGVPTLPEESLALLQSSVAATRCAACAARNAARVCEGGLGDRVNLTSSAACLRPIVDMFIAWATAVEEAYAGILDPRGGDLEVSLTILTTDEADIAATTKLHGEDAAGRRAAEVSLTLPLRELRPTHLGMAAYKLFHEMFVHAPEGWRAAGARTLSHDRCGIREGFVDAAAALVLDSLLRKPGKLPSFDHVLEEFREEIARAHADRFRSSASFAASQEARRLDHIMSSRQQGKRCFERLTAKKLGRRAARLAMCVNVLHLSDDERGEMLSLLDRATASATDYLLDDVQGARFSELLGALLAAADRGDPQEVQNIFGGVDAGEF